MPDYLLPCFAAALLLVACGGGGSSSSSLGSAISLTNGQAASVVVGNADFAGTPTGSAASTLYSPNGSVFVSGGKLYIPDTAYNRVVVFDSIPASSGASASYAIGQTDLTSSTGGTSDTALNHPFGTVISGGKLFVSDFSNNRVAIYNSVPTALTVPGTIDVVAGQADKTSSGTACTGTGFNTVGTVTTAGNKMVVADGGNNRVLIWNSIPTSDGTAPDLVLGQNDFTHCTANTGYSPVSASTLSFPGGVWTDGTRLVVLDYYNNRVLVWNTFPTSNNQNADLVLGQSDFTGFLSGTSATTLNGPFGGVFVSPTGQLFVTDTGNNRVLVWNTFPTSNGQAADRVLGQPDFATATTGLSATTLNQPSGVYASGTNVFVTDTINSRVLIY